MSRTSEIEIGEAVLHILGAQPNGRASVRKLKREMPDYVRLTSADRVRSETRRCEEIWEQQVRNLKSHSSTPGNIFCEGYVVQVARGVWELTHAGGRRIARAA